VIRAIIDVNVLLSAILGPLGISRRIVLAWEAGWFVPITSEDILRELHDKLRLPDIVRRFRITDADRSWIFGLLAAYAEMVELAPPDVPAVTGDPEDDAVLAAARMGRAEYLVTGDKGLLALRDHEGVRIVSPREFLEMLEASRSD
jgi:putative PIN family toxin of toxin-antitoxin system